MDNQEILLLKQDLKNHKEVSDEKLHNIEKQIQELDKRVKDMELSKEKTEYQYEQIMDTLNKLNEHTIPNLTKQIQELKNKPLERYYLIITTIIGTIVGAVVTFIVNNLIK